MSNHGLIVAKTSETDIESYRIVVNNTDKVNIAQGSDVYLYGVTGQFKSFKGSAADVICSGQACVELGGAIECNDPITSDSQGRGIKATKNGQYIIGYAQTAGSEDDVIDFDFAKGQFLLTASV